MSNVPFTIAFAETLGMEIVSATAEEVKGTLEVTEPLCTTGGRMHGGALMSFADTLGAVAAYLVLPEGSTGTTTLESKTNFTGGAKLGTTVTGITTPVHVGRRTSVWQTRIEDEDGKLVAVVTQTQLVL